MRIWPLLLLACALRADAPQNIVLDPQELEARATLDREAAIINLKYDDLRKSACWKRGLKPEECGNWIDPKTIQRVEVKEK